MLRTKNRLDFSTQPAVLTPFAPAKLPVADPSHPFILSVGPVLHHNGSYTTWSANNLSVSGTGYLEINSADADKLGIVAGDHVRVSAGNQSFTIDACLSNGQQPGNLFVPSHFRDSSSSLLAKSACNVIAVRLEKA